MSQASDIPVRGRDAPPDEGDADAVEVVRIAYPVLLHTARRLTMSASQAEDLVQEAFVETLSRYPRFEGIHAPIGYLKTVLYRAAFRRRRHSEVPLVLQERLEQEQPDPDTGAMITAVLASLAPRQRVCLILRYIYDLDDKEIARALDCRPSTVRSQIARGLANARKHSEVIDED